MTQRTPSFFSSWGVRRTQPLSAAQCVGPSRRCVSLWTAVMYGIGGVQWSVAQPSLQQLGANRSSKVIGSRGRPGVLSMSIKAAWRAGI